MAFKTNRLLQFISCALAVLWNFGPSAFADTKSDTSADNAKVNKEYHSKQEVTAEQQKNNDVDLKITQKIRQSLTNDKSLSTYGQNVKIITESGKVTLKGPVRTEKEKANIEHKAQIVAGADNVQDQLEVVKKN